MQPVARQGAVTAYGDLPAQGILAGLAARGIDVPSQISVVGCDDVLAATTDLALNEREEAVVSEPEAVLDAVRRWLDRAL